MISLQETPIPHDLVPVNSGNDRLDVKRDYRKLIHYRDSGVKWIATQPPITGLWPRPYLQR